MWICTYVERLSTWQNAHNTDVLWAEILGKWNGQPLVSVAGYFCLGWYKQVSVYRLEC